jgi:hypothetical protein
MVMTAYFDESGTHGDQSPMIIVAGFGATVAQWTGCEKRLTKLFSDFGVSHFHAKDFRQTKGEFKGWTVTKKGQFLSRFLRITDEQLTFGVAGIMRPEDYKLHYRDKLFPRGKRPDTAYGICFRTALVRSFLDYHDQRHNWPLNVVLELGHPNWKDAERVFKEIRADPRFDGMLGTVSFAAKKDCQFLGLADALAYALFRNTGGYTDAGKGVVPLGPADPPYYVHRLKMSGTRLDAPGLKKLYSIHSGSFSRALRS